MSKVKQIRNYFISILVLLLSSLTASCCIHSLCPLKERGDFNFLYLFYISIRNITWCFNKNGAVCHTRHMASRGDSLPILFTLWTHCPLMNLDRNGSLEQNVNPVVPWSTLWFYKWFKVYDNEGSAFMRTVLPRINFILNSSFLLQTVVVQKDF